MLRIIIIPTLRYTCANGGGGGTDGSNCLQNKHTFSIISYDKVSGCVELCVRTYIQCNTIQYAFLFFHIYVSHRSTKYQLLLRLLLRLTMEHVGAESSRDFTLKRLQYLDGGNVKTATDRPSCWLTDQHRRTCADEERGTSWRDRGFGASTGDSTPTIDEDD